MSVRLKNGTTVEDPRLDRLPQFDDRSKRYGVRAVVVGKKLRTRGWSVRHWLDQQQEGACVSFAWHHEALALPRRAKFSSDDEATLRARERYRVMQTLDEWPGEAYEGTSVLAGAKVMQQLGYFSEYRWAFNLTDLILAVGYEGPVVMGTDWYEGMYSPDAAGYLHASGDLVGGHAWLISSVSIGHNRATIWNSWGQGWGNNGRAFISFDDLEVLMAADGECCVPVNRQVV